MHMADALISPAVGGTMWAAAMGLTGYCSTKIKKELDDRKIPLMGVAGAFIFAAQMLNFTIPGTGSSGHLGGGLILAVLLGPHAAFLAMASVLTVQALFFADGGLLALGCNIINLGFFSCFVAYPLIFKPIAGPSPTRSRLITASLLAAVVGLQFGAFGVVLETLASGVSELPFGTFVFLMQPIHLAIGVVEGLATTAVVLFVWKARPEVLAITVPSAPASNRSFRVVLATLAVATLLAGGTLSWFASTRPDGLEWSMSRTSGKEELNSPADRVHPWLSGLQQKTAFLPDYGFKSPPGKDEAKGEEAEAWPAVDAGTSLSGLVGSALVLLVAALIGFVLRHRRSAARTDRP